MVSRILGPDGLPVTREVMEEEFAAPTVMGVRNVWTEGQASQLTPARLAEIMKAADQNDGHDYLSLAEEMEERETQYATVLGVRKRAVTGLEIQVDAASDDPLDVQIADEIRDIMNRPEIPRLITDMLDALGKGYSLIEILWNTTAARWMPHRFVWRDPRFFQFDRITGQELRLRVDGSHEGTPLPPFKFIKHTFQLKSGLPLRGGLARQVAWPYIVKQFTMRDWSIFVQTYGMPVRLGKYPTGSTETEKRTLMRAVRQIFSDAAAIIPDTMLLDFITGDKTGNGSAVFQMLASYLDEAISKLVLGQTLTTDKGANRAQAQVHDGVRKDILASDAVAIASTLERDLVQPYVDLNFGPRKHYPTIRLVIADNADIAVMTAALQTLVPMGLKVQMSDVRDTLGFTDPDADADLLTAPVAPAPAVQLPAFNRHGAGCPCCSEQLAFNAEALDAIGADERANWQEQMEPIMQPVFDLVAEAKSLEEIKARLPEIYGKMDTKPLEKQLVAATIKARQLGQK